ncbi:hypothetical protein [uncultured Shewanella sp.]|uniref:hypothetical protein n=1 Tax=uncultured Shewanella sp. TaxID=173975 RepID=UPI002611DCC3|nr:hypothetical protein [uncultured Shewanella sp.]
MIKKSLLSSAIIMGLVTSIPAQADIFSNISDWFDDNIVDPIEESLNDIDNTINDIGQVITLFDGSQGYDYELDTSEWAIKALRMQNRLDHSLPLSDALFIGTHNSFNASDYSNGISYIDPNHRLSLTDQLNAGMVALELDVHYDFNVNTGTDLMLCHKKEHGEISDGVCSIYDRTFKQGLTEINNWLNKNKEDVIFIYIEDFMEGDEYDKAIGYLNQTIGDKVYRPQGDGCQSIPMDVSKQDMLDQGKQVILFGRKQTCSAPSDWQSWAFGGSGWDVGKVEDVRNGKCKVPSEGKWLRYFEDRTVAGAVLAGRKESENIAGSDMQALMACDVNFIGLDMTGYAGTDRITGAIWSWKKAEPNNKNNQDCAQSLADGHFGDIQCLKKRRFACKSHDNDWYITADSGRWSEGKEMCLNETNGEYAFSVPMTYRQNYSLIQAKAAAGVEQVWLSYNDFSNEGQWVIDTKLNTANAENVAGSGESLVHLTR